jgi:hypothetical protein
MAKVLLVVAIIGVFWIGMLSAVFMGGLLFMILVAIFAVLKLAGAIDWSWWWVTLPIWGGVGGAVAKMWIVTRDPLWRFKVGQKE